MTAPTQTLQRILVATDQSEQANIAINRAVELASEHNAELIVLHVVDEELPPYARSYTLTATDRDIRNLLHSKPHSEEITITIDIVVGRPDLDITERAEIENADLIVVGLHDRILEENLEIQGSVVEQIIQETRRPVLVVKNQPRQPYSSVVAGVDFTDYSQAAARSAAIVAPKATLHLVHACQCQSSLAAPLRDSDTEASADDVCAARMNCSTMTKMAPFGQKVIEDLQSKPIVHHVLEHGNPHQVLLQQIATVNADLVSIGTHGRTGLSRALLGSVATDILNDRLVDVLVIRPE